MALLQPRKAKYRYRFRERKGGVPSRRTKLEFGELGLKSLGAAWISARQLEAARRAITHHTKRQGRVWFRVFPDKPVTKKPSEVRMGGGKGGLEGYVSPVKAGEIIVELGAVEAEIAREALRRASHKFPVKTVIVAKEDTR